jgi:hypothetical protein
VPRCKPAFWCCLVLRVLSFIKLNHEIELYCQPRCAALLGWALPLGCMVFVTPSIQVKELAYHTKQKSLPRRVITCPSNTLVDFCEGFTLFLQHGNKFLDTTWPPRDKELI